jgi:hypothetical protein
MNPVVEVQRMTRPKGRPKKPSGEGTAVRIDTDLVSKARYLCAQNGTSMTEYLSGLLRPHVEKDFRKAGKSLIEGEAEGESKR